MTVVAPDISFIPLDRAFGRDGVVAEMDPGFKFTRGFAVQPDDAVLAAGYVGEAPVDFALLRLTPDCQPDLAFNNGQAAIIDGGETFPHIADPTITLQPDGRMILGTTAGRVDESDVRRWLLARVTEDGRSDESFSGDGRLTITFPEVGASLSLAEVLLRADGRIVVIGGGFDSRICLAQLLPDGRFDRSFGQEGKLIRRLPGEDAFVTSAALDQDGNLVVAGTTAGVDTSTDMLVCRFRPDGTPDTTFGFAGSTLVDFGFAGENGFVLRLLPDGTMLVGGTATLDNSRRRPAVARLLLSGDLDPTFGGTGRVVIDVQHDVGFLSGLEPLPDGRIAVVGTAHPTDLGSGHAFALVLGPDGGLDHGFASDQELVFLDRVLDPLNLRLDLRLGVQSNGRLLVAISMRALLGLHSTTELGALRLTIGADQIQAGPGPLHFTVTVHNDGDTARGGLLTLRATKGVSVVSSSHGPSTVAPNRIDVTGKLRNIPAGAAATVVLRTTVNGFEEGIGLSGSVSSGVPELNTADNAASILVSTTRNPTI